MSNTVRWGVYGGICLVLLNLVLYLMAPKILLGWSASLVGIVIYVFFMWKAASDEKAAQGGYLSWGEALKPLFLSFVIMSLFGVVFQYLLWNFIDPQTMQDLAREMAIEMTEKLMRMAGQDEIPEDVMESLEANLKMTPGKTLLGWAVSLIFPGFAIAAIMGLVVRKDRPAGTVV